MSNKTENDDIKVIKTSFKKIVRNHHTYEIIENIVKNTNILVLHTYTFLKLFLIYKYDNAVDKNLKIHTILSYITTKGNIGCINRDKNAVLNMRKILRYQLQYGLRPTRYSREKKLKETLTNITNIEKKEKLLREKLKEKCINILKVIT